VRIYVPATLAHLRALISDGVHDPVGGITAFAVTGSLRQWFQSGDEEELEYAATSDAAYAALRLLAQDALLPMRRVVIAADINSSLVRADPAADRASVLIEGPLKLTQIESVLVDGDEAISDVTIAAGVLSQSESGDADAEFLVSQAAGHELLWYSASEISELLLVDG
jgi:hypothetical protein